MKIEELLIVFWLVYFGFRVKIDIVLNMGFLCGFIDIVIYVKL